MARQKNDGRGRLGGRQKGTPNKVTADIREWLTDLINKNRKQMEKDLKALEPRERLQVLEKLMQYAIPKQQAVRADVGFDAEELSFTSLLMESSYVEPEAPESQNEPKISLSEPL